jgi:hypothetical protein
MAYRPRRAAPAWESFWHIRQQSPAEYMQLYIYHDLHARDSRRSPEIQPSDLISLSFSSILFLPSTSSLSDPVPDTNHTASAVWKLEAAFAVLREMNPASAQQGGRE